MNLDSPQVDFFFGFRNILSYDEDLPKCDLFCSAKHVRQRSVQRKQREGAAKTDGRSPWGFGQEKKKQSKAPVERLEQSCSSAVDESRDSSLTDKLKA